MRSKNNSLGVQRSAVVSSEDVFVVYLLQSLRQHVAHAKYGGRAMKYRVQRTVVAALFIT